MKKRAKVHLLPADGWQEIGTTLHARGNHDTNYTPHNIYITTDDEIKEGDWFIAIDSSIQIAKSNYEKLPNDKKIIATTDPELIVYVGQDYTGTVIRKNGKNYQRLPQPSKSFIEEYCKAGGIDEVDVEYGRTMDGTPTYNRLALTSNNEIIIHLIDQEKRDCLIAFDDWFNKNWYPEQYSILAIEAYLKTIQ